MANNPILLIEGPIPVIVNGSSDLMYAKCFTMVCLLSYIIVCVTYVHPTSTNMIPHLVCLPEFEGVFPSVNMALLIVCFAVLKYNIPNSRKESTVDNIVGIPEREYLAYTW